MSNPIRKLLGQTAVYGLSSIIGRLLNYLLVPLYTSVFIDPSDYGVVSELYAWVAFLVVLLTFGMETAFFRFLQQKEDKEAVFRNGFLTVIGINVIFYFALLYFNQDIADLMLYSDHNEYIILLGTIVCIDAITALPLAKLRSEERAARFATIQFASIILNVVLNLFFMLVIFNPELPEEGVLFILFSNLFASLLKPIMLYKDFSELRFSFDRELAKEMIFYSFPLVIAGFAGIINETLDRILLKQILFVTEGSSAEALHIAETEVGIYSACYKLAMLVTILLQAYRYAAEPFFFAQMKSDDRNKVYARVMNFFIGVVCLVFLVVSLNLDIFKHFIQNEAYWEGLNVVPILLMANVCLGIYYNQSIWYKLSGRTSFGAYIAIGGALLTVVINVLFIPEYGYMASAWATLVVYAAQMIASYTLGQRFYPIKYNQRKFALYIGGALLIFFLCSVIDLQTLTSRFIVHNGFILLYVAMVYQMERNSLRKVA
jgi:O-antigen/teichoic acid export membrane protein